MCDTIVALGPATLDGATLFGKNSDREPDEAQNIRIRPRRQHKAGDTVQCTYISIPQVSETAGVMLCQPFWMFGAEMGANEHGVVIGNEALFTREKPDATGLTGMDILRLALERSKTARQALQTIIGLLEEHGQGGNSGYRINVLYMNGFIIADHREAYVLETVRSWWAWKRVTDLWSISNIISLEDDYDECSPGLIENAIKRGYCKSEADFSFKRCYSDRVMTWGAKGRARQARSRQLLSTKKGALTTADFTGILRDHGGDPDWTPVKSDAPVAKHVIDMVLRPRTPGKSGGTICMHAADKLVRRSQSVCSMVARIARDRQFVYTTGASNPCLTPYWPIFLPGTAIPAGYEEAGARYDAGAFWWECERLHREALWHFVAARDAIKPVVADYEKEMMSSIEGGMAPMNQTTVDRYFSAAKTITGEWGATLDRLPITRYGRSFRRYWQKYNELNGIS